MPKTPKDIRMVLEDFEQGRPGAWTHENLLWRARRLAVYCRNLIRVRGVELGTYRDHQSDMREKIDHIDAELAVLEGDAIDLENRLKVALAVLTALEAIDQTPEGERREASESSWWSLAHEVLTYPDNVELLKAESPLGKGELSALLERD